MRGRARLSRLARRAGARLPAPAHELPVESYRPAERATDGRSQPTRHGDVPRAYMRTRREHQALVAELQREVGPLPAPADAAGWSDAMLRRWFEDGGNLSLRALSSEPLCAATQRLVDSVGEGLPAHEVEPVDLGVGGLVGALARHDDAALDKLVAHLAARDSAVCRLGIGAASLSEIRSQAEGARAQMRPGEVRACDGAIISGASPSGAERGDVYARTRELGHRAWPALAAADATLGTVASLLAPRLARHPLDLAIGARSDTLVARFAGDGRGYGAHFDGDASCALTAIMYTSPAWDAAHGGRLLMLDEARRCWWAVPPREDTLVVFRSDRVLHKVEACHVAPRHALTVFLHAARVLERAALAASPLLYGL